MIATSFKKAIKEADNHESWYPSVFVFENLTNESEFASQKEAFNYIKENNKKSNQKAIYYPICGYYMAIDVDCDIEKGIKKGILKKSDALKLIEISKKRGFYDYHYFKDVETLIDETFPCYSRENDTDCINCGNCD